MPRTVWPNLPWPNLPCRDFITSFLWCVFMFMQETGAPPMRKVPQRSWQWKWTRRRALRSASLKARNLPPSCRSSMVGSSFSRGGTYVWVVGNKVRNSSLLSNFLPPLLIVATLYVYSVTNCSTYCSRFFLFQCLFFVSVFVVVLLFYEWPIKVLDSLLNCTQFFRSETDSLQSKSRETRTFCVRVQMKNEACLVEVTPNDEKLCIGTQLRSRGCYVLYNVRKNRLFLWQGSKCTKSLRKSGKVAAKMLKNRWEREGGREGTFPPLLMLWLFFFPSRLHGPELIRVNEGEEPNDLCCLLGNKESYISLANGMRLVYHYTHH